MNISLTEGLVGTQLASGFGTFALNSIQHTCHLKPGQTSRGTDASKSHHRLVAHVFDTGRSGRVPSSICYLLRAGSVIVCVRTYRIL